MDESLNENKAPGPVAAIVLAAGRSKRMLSTTPKVLHQVLGLPLIIHVIDALAAARVERAVLIANAENRAGLDAAVAAHRAETTAPLPKIDVALQAEPRGTADAVLSARAALGNFTGTAIVLCGDAPCVSPRSLERLLAYHRERAAFVTVLSGEVDDATGYGRIVRGPDGDLAAIVEEKDLAERHRAIKEINSGIIALELPGAWETLAKIQPSRAGELYLTDAVSIAKAEKKRAVAVRAAEPDDVLGVNDREDLALVTRVLKRRVCQKHMQNGVTIVDPETTFIDPRATIGRDTTILPFVVIDGPCSIGEGVRVGPFAHVRGASRIGSGGAIGNFVEVARSTLDDKARALHLAYLGDATIGAGANLGCGTITANFDGKEKHKTTVGARAHVGSGTVLIAPCELGEGAITGAGAVVTAHTKVPGGETWVGVPAHALVKSQQEGRRS